MKVTEYGIVSAASFAGGAALGGMITYSLTKNKTYAWAAVIIFGIGGLLIGQAIANKTFNK